MGMIIPTQTTAKTEIFKITRNMLPATIKIAGVPVAETIVVNEVDEAGGVVPAINDAGDAIVLSLATPSFVVYSKITLQFVKAETVGNALGVQIND